MKKPVKKYMQLDIPNPCHEDWDKMTPCTQGRHCSHCNKTVIDFSAWGDAALYSFFAKNTGNVCGMFAEAQLGRPIQIPPQPHSRLYRMVVAMGLTLMAVQAGSVYAQSRAPQVQGSTAKDRSDVDAGGGTGKIQGVVLDEKKQPVIGAIVQVIQGGVVKGGASTDFDGFFEIQPLEPGAYDVQVNYLNHIKEERRDVRVAADGTCVAVMVQLRVDSAKQLAPVVIRRIMGGSLWRSHDRIMLSADEIRALSQTTAPDTVQTKQSKIEAPGKRTYKREEIKNMPIR